MDEGKNEIAILDFGSQYTHLIARRVRELGVISYIYPNNIKSEDLTNAAGIILSGGPRSLVNQPKLEFDSRIFELGLPILGLCYGHQLMADFFGGKVSRGTAREYGLAKIKTFSSPIFKNVDEQTVVWMSHGDHVEKLPENFKTIACSGNDSITAMADENKKFYGFQFHPEVRHSSLGKQMLKNFVFDICGAIKNWNTDEMLEEIQANIKQEAGDKNVFLLVSGGVDSTVCFALLEKTLGKERVYGLHVDHGLERINESQEVKQALSKIGLDDLHIYDAKQKYLKALQNIVEPEQKRKIIGDLFLEITDRVMAEKNMGFENWLIGQGTIYPDTIESGGTKNADVIKTHHNRVPKIQEMIEQGKIIEPIRELYKDEVRQIGLKLGLPEELVNRHPFPGPGLGIRCLCSEGSPDLPEKRDDFYKLPIKSVGVQGDERSYQHPALLLTEEIDWEVFEKISPQIANQNKDINRVLFLLAGDKEKIKDSSLKQACLTDERLETLRKIDKIVNDVILTNADCRYIWQMPIVLIPFGYDREESVILRPVESEEAMTVSFARLADEILEKIKKEIQKTDSVDFVFYDITNKPPGTIEWE